MDNSRYISAPTESALSASAASAAHPSAKDPILVTLAVAALLVLCSNALRITGIVPDGGLLKVIAPFGATAGAVVLAMAVARLRPRGRGTGFAVEVPGMLLALGTVALATIEIVTNYVFPALDDAPRQAVLAGWTGTYLTVISIGYVVVALLFAVTAALTRTVPIGAVTALALGGTAIGLRTLLPVPIVALGLVLLGVGALWLAVTSRRPLRTTTTGAQ